MDPEIKITAEPIDAGRCKFLVSVPVTPGGVRRFTSPAEAQDSPLVTQIFAIPGARVSEVIVSGNLVTVVKSDQAPWTMVGRDVGKAIRAALAGATPPVAVKTAPANPGDHDTLYHRVARLFEDEGNRTAGRHGGRVDVIDVQDA